MKNSRANKDEIVVLGSVVKRWASGMRRWTNDILEVDHLKNENMEAWRITAYMAVYGKNISAQAPTLEQAELLFIEDSKRLLPFLAVQDTGRST